MHRWEAVRHAAKLATRIHNQRRRINELDRIIANLRFDLEQFTGKPLVTKSSCNHPETSAVVLRDPKTTGYVISCEECKFAVRMSSEQMDLIMISMGQKRPWAERAVFVIMRDAMTDEAIKVRYRASVAKTEAASKAVKEPANGV